MTLANPEDINLDTENVVPVKVFDKASYREREGEIKDSIPECENSEMKIFVMQK